MYRQCWQKVRKYDGHKHLNRRCFEEKKFFLVVLSKPVWAIALRYLNKMLSAYVKINSKKLYLLFFSIVFC